MPFGPIYAALFFGVICATAGVRLAGQPATSARIAGLSLVLLGTSLALGLLLRRGWARWSGVLGAAAVAVIGLQRALLAGSALDHLLWLGAVLAVVLLAVPATGGGEARPGRSAAGPVLALLAALGAVGLLSAGWWTQSSPAVRAAATELPTAAIARRIAWSDYANGLERARSEDKPLLVVFYAGWCPYCKKMDRETWKTPRVVERFAEIVAVQVDAEQERVVNGHVGAELARRFGVGGYPALRLLDAQGNLLSRHDGFLAPGQFLSWLDAGLGRTLTRLAPRDPGHD